MENKKATEVKDKNLCWCGHFKSDHVQDTSCGIADCDCTSFYPHYLVIQKSNDKATEVSEEQVCCPNGHGIMEKHENGCLFCDRCGFTFASTEASEEHLQDKKEP